MGKLDFDSMRLHEWLKSGPLKISFLFLCRVPADSRFLQTPDFPRFVLIPYPEVVPIAVSSKLRTFHDLLIISRDTVDRMFKSLMAPIGTVSYRVQSFCRYSVL